MPLDIVNEAKVVIELGIFSVESKHKYKNNVVSKKCPLGSLVCSVFQIKFVGLKIVGNCVTNCVYYLHLTNSKCVENRFILKEKEFYTDTP